MTPNARHSDARSVIFASIRDNLAASAPFDAIRSEHHRDVTPELTPELTPNVLTVRDRGEIINAFKESLELVGAKCSFVDSEAQAAERFAAIVNGLDSKNVVISDSELVYRIVEASRIDAIQDPSRDELFSSDIGVTSAQWAIAETGTLVLGSGAERHRLVSLVPPVHVCILMERSIRQSMAEILEAADIDTNWTITFITGASRTSDIELTLAIGVHGPGELHVIVIRDD